jgi:DNA-binding CsgD family transcriptional regulator
MQPEAPLVGREASLSELVARGERAAAGRGGLVLVAGEAGVGKTRLAAEALERLPVPVLAAACAEGGTAPYTPLAEVLRAFLRLHPRGLDGLGAHKAHLARLLPELGDPASGTDRVAIAAAITAAFNAFADAEPLAVLLDDLQWADEATLDALPALAETASSTPLLIVGAYRSDELPRGHALRRARTALRRARRLDELAVEPLDATATRELAAAILDAPVSPTLAAALWDRTQGVPFFVEETAAALAASRRLVAGRDGVRLREDENVPLPETVRDAVLARLEGVAPETRAALEVAATVGTAFELEVVDVLGGRAGIEEAIARGVVVERDDGVASFRHALAREAVYADMTFLRRRDLHAEIAQLLSARAAPPESIARHLLAAGRSDAAVPLLLEAGASYCAMHAHRDAARLVRRALELWPGGDGDPRRIDALAQLARCLHLSGNTAEAATVWREVVGLRNAENDVDATAEAQRELANVLDLLGRMSDALAAHAAAAAAFLEAGRDRDAVRERLIVAQFLRMLGSPAEGAAAIREVQAAAARIGDEEVRLVALAEEGFIQGQLGHHEQGLAIVGEALAGALAGGFADAAAEAYRTKAAMLMAGGDYGGARTTLEDAVDYCARTGEEDMRRFCTACLSYVLSRTGAWDRAVELARAVRADQTEDAVSQTYAAIAWGSIEEARGHARRARPLLAAAAAQAAQFGLPPGITAKLEFALVRLDSLSGDSGAAAERCHRTLAECEAAGKAFNVHTPLLRWASAFFADRGADRETRACATLLTGTATRIPRPEHRAAAAAALGEVSLGEGEAASAASYFTHALELLAEIELPFERAELELRAAKALAAADEHDGAVERLVSAYRTARRLGAKPLAAEAARALEALGERVDERLGRVAAAHARPGGLSRRELEVLRLVAVGRTNREIAQVLFLSPRTVDMHVRNALAKLDCRTRTEASSRAIALGLIDAASSDSTPAPAAT